MFLGHKKLAREAGCTATQAGGLQSTDRSLDSKTVAEFAAFDDMHLIAAASLLGTAIALRVGLGYALAFMTAVMVAVTLRNFGKLWRAQA